MRGRRNTLSTIALALVALVAAALYQTANKPSRGPSAESSVRHVIDGDTVELSDGRHLRYIGINAPEIRRRVGDRWIKDPEPYGQAAAERNRELVEGKPVRLEFDAQTHDRYGRLLAYVYVAGPSGEIMVNRQLTEEGFAQPMTIPPNVAHAEEFRQLAKEARQAKRGLWKDKL